MEMIRELVAALQRRLRVARCRSGELGAVGEPDHAAGYAGVGGPRPFDKLGEPSVERRGAGGSGGVGGGAAGSEGDSWRSGGGFGLIDCPTRQRELKWGLQGLAAEACSRRVGAATDPGADQPIVRLLDQFADVRLVWWVERRVARVLPTETVEDIVDERPEVALGVGGAAEAADAEVAVLAAIALEGQDVASGGVAADVRLLRLLGSGP